MDERKLQDGVVEIENFEQERKKQEEKQMRVAIILNQVRIPLADQSAYRNLQDGIIAAIEDREYIYDNDIEFRVEKIIREAVKRCKQDATSKKLLEEIFHNSKEEEIVSVKKFIEAVAKFVVKDKKI